MEPKRLYRSVKNKVLCGVCGGIGEYLQVDPVMIRLIWVLLMLLQSSFVPVIYGIFPGGRKSGSLYHCRGHHTPGTKG